jgi:hypothetical protein
MLCQQLILIVGSTQALLRGSFAREPAYVGDLHAWELDAIHTGKDASITHSLAGGNGFSECHYLTHMARAAFDAGQTTERRDLRSLRYWQESLEHCRRDMHRRFQV